MPGKDKIELLVEGGKAGPDPNSAQKLSAYKMNIGEVFQKVNSETSEYKGMQVPVEILIDKDTKTFEIKVGMPPTSSMLKKEMGIAKAAFPLEEEKMMTDKVVGNLSMEHIVKVAKIKMKQMLVKNDLKEAAKQVIGTVVSMQGIRVENKMPKEIIEEIKQGKWDQSFTQ